MYFFFFFYYLFTFVNVTKLQPIIVRTRVIVFRRSSLKKYIFTHTHKGTYKTTIVSPRISPPGKNYYRFHGFARRRDVSNSAIPKLRRADVRLSAPTSIVPHRLYFATGSRCACRIVPPEHQTGPP